LFLNLSLSTIFLVFLLYKFYLGFNGEFINIVFFILSMVFTSFLLNKLKFSENKIIKILQFTIIYSLIFALILGFFISVCVGYELFLGEYIECSNNDSNNNINNDNDKYYKFPKGPVDMALGIAKETSKAVVEHVIPNIGAGAAACTVAAAAYKASLHLPIPQRLAVVGGTAFATSAGVQGGISGVQALVKHSGLKESIQEAIKNSPHSDPKIDRIPTPEPFIQSPLENWEIETSPLETLLSSILSLNVCIFLLLLILFYLFIYNYLLSKNKDFILKLVNYWLVKFKFSKETIERVEIWINKLGIYNNMYLTIFSIIICIFIFSIIVLNIYFVSELKNNIDSFVEVYNYLHKKV
jgi:hypothetical protein